MKSTSSYQLFYALCPDMKDKTKKALLDTGTTQADNVFLFLRHVQQIAEKKIEDYPKPSRRAERQFNWELLAWVCQSRWVCAFEDGSYGTSQQDASQRTLLKEFANKETEQQCERDFERADHAVKTPSCCEGDLMYCSSDEEDGEWWLDLMQV